MAVALPCATTPILLTRLASILERSLTLSSIELVWLIYTVSIGEPVIISKTLCCMIPLVRRYLSVSYARVNSGTALENFSDVYSYSIRSSRLLTAEFFRVSDYALLRRVLLSNSSMSYLGYTVQYLQQLQDLGFGASYCASTPRIMAALMQSINNTVRST